jgi:transcriptional regulator with XRE-family HTH domain
MVDDWMTQGEVASRLGVSRQTLTQWVTAEWFPANGRRGRSKWNLTAIQRARESLGGRSQVMRAPEDEGSKTQQQRKLEAEIRLKEAQADLEELEVGKEMGLLLPRMSAELALSTILGDIRRFFAEQENLTHQIPPGETTGQITADSVRAWLYARHDAYQDGLAERIQNALVDLGPVPDLQSLAESSRQPAEAPPGEHPVVGGTVDRTDPGRGEVEPG